MATRGEINSNFYQLVNTDTNGNVTAIKPEFLSNVSSNTANYANYAGTAYNVSGSNVSGAVANAAHATVANSANSVAVANVTGIGNIATVNLDGNVSNILYGNGVFSAVPDVNNVAYANYANFAGNALYANIAELANSVAGANVTGTVADAVHATVAESANSVAGGNVVGYVNDAVHANVANVANLVSGSNVSGDVSGANHANIADVANLVAGSNVTGVVANANYASYSSNSDSVNATVANVKITGGTTGQYLQTDGTGNLSFATVNATPGGVNTQVQFNDDGSFAGNNYFTFDKATTKLSLDTSSVGDGATPSILLKRNISGISGGDISINITSDSIVGAETGTTTSLPTISGFGITANSLGVAGRVTSNLVPNATTQTLGSTTTGWGNLYMAANTRIWLGNALGAYLQGGPSSLSTANTLTFTTGNVVANSKVQANYFVGDGANISNIAGANVTGQVGNALVAGTVTTNAQPNITTVGTLTTVSIAGNIETVDGIKFDTANGFAVTQGQLSWDSGAGTLDLGLTGSNVIAHLGEDLLVQAFNDSGVALTKGQIVYISGAQGNRVAVKLAQANGELTSRGTLGMVAESIAINGTGYVVTNGTVNKLNTDGLTAGFPIYLSATTPGAYTQTAPASPNHLVILGWVERVHQTVGSIYIKVDNGYELDELHDVTITSPANGQSLIYSSGLWVNGIAQNSVTVTQANQPNITNVGTLNGLEVIGNIDVTGNFNVTGNLNYENVTDLVVGDPLIYLGANNTGNLVDLGFVASYNDGNYEHTGIARNHNDGTWTFFDKVVAEPTTVIDWANASYPNVKMGSLTVVGNISATQITANINGANVIGAVANATYAANSGYATVAADAYSVDGANVSGQVGFANMANYAGNVTVAAQPNITSLGTLTSLVVGGNITPNANATYSLGNVTNKFKDLYLSGTTIYLDDTTISATNGNISLGNFVVNGTTGTIAGANVSGDVSGANHANIADVANSVAGSNVVGDVAGSNHANIADVANSVAGANVSGTVANATYAITAGTAYSVDGANVVGYVADATHANIADVANSVSGVVANATHANVADVANSVQVANVNGIGNIATLNLDGSSSTVLYGNGVFASVTGGANANFANFAGEAFSVSVANIVGTVNLANFATVANTVAGANVTGQVGYAAVANSVAGSNVVGSVADAANAQYANIANIANIAYSVSVANVSGIGNIATLNLDGNSGNILFGNGSFGPVPDISNVANANFANFAGEAFSVSGSNVSGTVANATHAVSADSATTAGVVTTNAQPNITSTGTLTGLDVNGNITASRIISNVATGTAPFVVTSITTVANLAAATAGVAGSANAILTKTSTNTVVPILGINNNSNNYTSTPIKSADSLTMNLANSSITATTFVGSLSGTASSATVANSANSVAGANVTGTVANATYATNAGTATSANSVAVANVSGIGNIATVNLNGNSSQVLYGNGVFAEVTVAPSSNANYANFAGEAFSVSVANIVGTVNLANFATVANSVAGGNVSGAVANATYAVTSGSSDSVAGANVSGTVANATYSVTAGTAYSVSGANVVGEVANAGYATTAGSASTAIVANSIAGANVSGTVANATYAVSAGSATIADSANSVAVANVTGIGNIAVINLNGNGSQVLAGNGVFIAQSGGGSGTPGGSNTQLQFNNNGSFGGISTVTYDGTNISLGAVTTVKITGGANTQVLSTDGTGNLSWVSQSGGGGATVGLEQTFLFMGA